MGTPRHFPRFRTVGFVGARNLGAVAEDLVRLKICDVLDRLARELGPDEFLVGVSALALGGDTIFAEVLAERNIPHQVFLPQTPDAFFTLRDFNTEALLERSRSALTRANVIEVRLASSSPDRGTRFTECGYEIVDESDIIIAVRPHEAAVKQGGTLETLLSATALGRRAIEIVLSEEAAIRETPAPAASTDRRAEADIFDWILEWEDANPNGPTEALKQRASDISRQKKRSYRFASVFIILTHAAATVAAAWALADLAGKGRMHLLLVFFKAVLLLAGLALPLVLGLRRPQGQWLSSRLTAELCRSVLAVRGLAGELSFLRTLYLPEWRRLLRSLNILHLQAARTSPEETTKVTERYIRERIGDSSTGKGQASFYHFRSTSAQRKRRWLETAFYIFSPVALACAVYYLFTLYFHELSPDAPPLERLVKLFIPAGFPMLAAAAIALITSLDLDRAAERYRDVTNLLMERRRHLSATPVARTQIFIIHHTERALLQEVIEWYGKNAHMRES